MNATTHYFFKFLLLSVILGWTFLPVGANAQTTSSNDPIAHGSSLLEEERFKEAKRVFSNVKRGSAEYAQAQAGLAQIDIATGKVKQALSKLDKLIKANPDYLHAYLLRGIANREVAKFRTLNQERYWDASQEDFSHVLSRDSAFKDVLYQMALWHRYRDAYDEAINLGHAQLQIKPDSAALSLNLFSLYRYYIRHTNTDDALQWLRARDSAFDRYFLGEVHRRSGDLDAADQMYKMLLFKEKTMALQPVHLSRARVYYAKNSPTVAQSYVERAISSIENEHHAQLILEDVKHLITDIELDLFRSLTSPEEWQAFFYAFWARRDPTPPRPENVRMTEHYRRLLIAEKQYEYDGFRLWHNNPDRLNALKFPNSYTLNEEFNDKGLIFIRHGEPYDTEIHVGGDLEYRSVIDNTTPLGSPVEYSSSKGWQPNESWQYTTPQRMDFHFVMGGGGGANAWRLVPEISNIDILISREHWGPLYYELADAARSLASVQGTATSRESVGDPSVASLDEETQSEFATSQDSVGGGSSTSRSVDLGFMDANNRKFLEFTSLRNQMIEESTVSVDLALTTDQHTWADEVEPIPMPYQIASFRGEKGETQLDIYFAIPIGTISKKIGQSSGSIEMEMGYALHDTSWTELHRSAEAKRIPAHQNEDAAAIDFFTINAPSDSLFLSIYSRPLETTQLSGYKFTYDVPDYSQDVFMMSDILLADFIGPAQSGSRFDRGDFHVSPNPFHRYATTQPVFVYFELYNLTYSSNELAEFTVEYILTGESKRRRKRKRRPLLTLQIDRTAEVLSPVEIAEVDVTNINPGNYLLTIRVTDKNTGAQQEKSRSITLY